MAAAHSSESPLAVQLDAYRPSSLLLGFPESDLDPVAAFASRTAATPLLADAAVTADAPVEADSVSLSQSLLHRRICDELVNGFIVDDENSLPWLEELAMSTSRHELTLPVTGLTAGASNDHADEFEQTEESFSNELSALSSEADQPETPAEAVVDDAVTFALLSAPEDLNEVMDATVGLTFDEAMGGPMDASWPRTPGR